MVWSLNYFYGIIQLHTHHGYKKDAVFDTLLYITKIYGGKYGIIWDFHPLITHTSNVTGSRIDCA